MHLNEFNMITNQLSFMEIEFDAEIYALIVLASLPNSWKAMRTAVSNSAGKDKFKYDDMRDLILIEERSRHRQCKNCRHPILLPLFNSNLGGKLYWIDWNQLRESSSINWYGNECRSKGLMGAENQAPIAVKTCPKHTKKWDSTKQ